MNPVDQVNALFGFRALTKEPALVGMVNAAAGNIPVPEANAAGCHGQVHLLLVLDQRLIHLLAQRNLLLQAFIALVQRPGPLFYRGFQGIVIARQQCIEALVHQRPARGTTRHQMPLPGTQQHHAH